MQTHERIDDDASLTNGNESAPLANGLRNIYTILICSRPIDLDSSRSATCAPGAINRSKGTPNDGVEFCTNDDSLIGSRCPKSTEVVRITIKDDVTTPGGLAKAREAVSDDSYTLLWAAIPCTGAPPWQHVNLARCGPKTELRA